MTLRYPAYRESGVEWVDKLPSHWSEGRLRWLANRYAGGTPDKNRLDFWEDGDIPWLASGAVNQGTIVEPSAFITGTALQHSSARWIPVGAVLMALAGQGKTKGMVARLGIRSTCNQSMAAIVPTSDVTGDYLYWWLTSNYQSIRNMAGGDDRDGLNLEIIASISTPLPPLPEQTAIAAFLDRETAKIDALVAEQRRLIDLLREKRQAVISHAVTKGLNPTAPLKPSGIDWLGDVPEGWTSCPTGRFATVLSGFAFPSTGFSHDEQDIPLLRGINVGVGEIRWDDTVYWKRQAEDGLDPWVVREGDLIIGMDRPWVSAGVRVAIVTRKDLPCLLLQRVAAIRTSAGLDQRYLMLHLSSDAFVHFFLPDMTGVSVPHISPTQIKEFPIVVPPLQEQVAIVEFVADQTAKLDTLTATAETAITLLQERRAALISAAVTGKIDVRENMTDEVAA